MSNLFAGIDWKRWELTVRADTVKRSATSASEATMLLLPPKNLPVGETYWLEVQWRKKVA